MPLTVLTHVPLEYVRKAVVHIEGRFLVHGGVHQLSVQLSGDLVSLFAQAGGEGADLVAVEIDGGHQIGRAHV